MGDLVDPKPNLDVDEGPVYTPQDALGRSARSAMMTGAAGLFIASVQNTVAKEQIGAFGVFTRFGRTIGLLSTIKSISELVPRENLTIFSGDGRRFSIHKHCLCKSTGKE